MSAEDLNIYLKDHLAGSVAAVELLDHLINTYAGKSLEPFFTDLRTEITADQNELHDLMRALAVKESSVRNAGAWIAEKFAQMKLGLVGDKEGGLDLLLALEAIEIGITGKRLLWRTLRVAMKSSPQLRPMDFARLERRALEQQERIEAKRLQLAQQTFAAGWIDPRHSKTP